MKRRQFLQASAALAGSAFLHSLGAFGRSFSGSQSHSDQDPIQKVAQRWSTEFNGDNPDFAHQILWDKWNLIKSLGGIPAATNKFETVIVGGGMAGLLAAHQLRDQSVLLLEQAPQFGGNSKGESYAGSAYTLGAAYFTSCLEGDEKDRLLTELNLWPEVKKEDSMSVFFQGQRAEGFWEGVTDPENRDQISRVYDRLKEINTQQFPEIPLSGDPDNQALVRQWDDITFKTWLDQEFGTVHDHILEYFQLYCWSSFGANLSEVSAAQMLNFLASETDGVLTLPGGNARIAQALFHSLHSSTVQLQANAIVVDIRVLASEVQITYLRGEKLESVMADRCIFTAPKLMYPKLQDDCPAEVYQAVRRISYRPYIVGNLILDRKLDVGAYDLYSLQGAMPENPESLNTSERGFADLVVSTWGQQGQTVLSLFKPLAFQGAHQFLFTPWAHANMEKQFVESLKGHQRGLGLQDSEISRLRLTRWGHSLPVAWNQMISQDALTPLHGPLNGVLSFAGQDIWVNPSFETAHATALSAIANLE